MATDPYSVDAIANQIRRMEALASPDGDGALQDYCNSVLAKLGADAGQQRWMAAYRRVQAERQGGRLATTGERMTALRELYANGHLTGGELQLLADYYFEGV